MNVYRHRFSVRCPVNGVVVEYQLQLATTAVVQAEAITAACQVDCGLHEEIADKLLVALGGVQVLRAHHHGVDIETWRGGVGWRP